MLAILLTIALLHWLALVTPGPNVLLVSQLAASGDRKSACIASVGISAVAIIWALLAVLGVNALFTAHSQIRLAVQIAGGLYLCYFALKMWRSGASVERHSAQVAPWSAFRLGFLTNITNPKSALFFGSVFATALPAEPSPSLLAAAVVLAFLNALIWHIVLAVAFSHSAVQAGYERRRKLLSRAASGIFGVYGIRLLVATANEVKAR